MAATFSVTLDKNLAQIQGSGYKYRVRLDVDKLIIATRAVITNVLIVAKNNVSRMTERQIRKMEIIDSQIQKPLRPPCNDFYFWLPFQTSIEFLKFLTGSEVEEDKRKYVASRFNDGQFKYEF